MFAFFWNIAFYPFIITIVFFFVTVVELPDEPDGKKFEVYLEREGQVEASTQTTRPLTVITQMSLISYMAYLLYVQAAVSWYRPLSQDICKISIVANKK